MSRTPQSQRIGDHDAELKLIASAAIIYARSHISIDCKRRDIFGKVYVISMVRCPRPLTMGLGRRAHLSGRRVLLKTGFNACGARDLRSVALALGVQLTSAIVRTPQDVHDVLSTAKSRGIAGLNVLASPVLFALRYQVIADLNRAGLPAVFEWGFIADEGALMGYGPLLGPLYRRLFDQAIGLLRGGRLADYPVEQPTRFDRVINTGTAQAIGVTIPQSLLLRADRIVK